MLSWRPHAHWVIWWLKRFFKWHSFYEFWRNGHWTATGQAQKLLSFQDITISLRNEHDGLSRIGILRGCQFRWELWGLHEITRFSRGERLGPGKNCLSEVARRWLNWINVNKKCSTLLNVMLVGGARGLRTRPNRKPNQTKSQPIRSGTHYSMVGGASTAEGLQSKFIPGTWIELPPHKRGTFIIIDGSEWDSLAHITQWRAIGPHNAEKYEREKNEHFSCFCELLVTLNPKRGLWSILKHF